MIKLNKKIILFASTIIIIVFLAALIFKPNIMLLFFKLSLNDKEISRINIVPTEINIKNNLQPEIYSEIFHQQIKFRVPWTNITNTKKLEYMSTYEFSSGKTISITHDNIELLYELINYLNDNVKNTANKKILSQILNNEIKTNNYDFYMEIIKRSNKNTSIFTSPKLAQNNLFSLQMKKEIFILCDKNIYNFSLNNINGYYCDAGNHKLVIIYDLSKNPYILENGAKKYTIFLDINTSREEIDYIISTIEFIK